MSDRTNAGSATGLTWDNERRLTGWTSGSGATTATAAYDGEGNRVALQTITTAAPPPTPGRVKPLGPVGYTSTTSTTYYVLGLEDVTGGVLTKYIGAGGTLPSAVRVGTTLSYLATDGIGSVSEALDTSGNVTAQQLYAPYGAIRYQVGTLPTTKGYAGQRQDVSSGLNDDVARYYDGSTEQFASADTGNGLDRLAYVGGNPETLTDPTGHVIVGGDGGGSGGGNGGCYSDSNCGGGYDGSGGSGGNGTSELSYTGNGPCNSGADNQGCTQGPVIGPPILGNCADVDCAQHNKAPAATYCDGRDGAGIGGVCTSGNDPNRLISLLGSEWNNATSLVGEGLEGLYKLIQLMQTILGQGRQQYEDEIRSWNDAVLFWTAVSPLDIGALGIAADALVTVKMLEYSESMFTKMMNQTIDQLQTAYDRLSQGGGAWNLNGNQEISFTVTEHNYDLCLGCNGTWQGQYFTIQTTITDIGPYSL